MGMEEGGTLVLLASMGVERGHSLKGGVLLGFSFSMEICFHCGDMVLLS